MGLDMYLYRARKESDFEKAGITIPLDEFEKHRDMYKALMPFLTKVDHLTPCYDIDKICQDFGLDRATIYLCFQSSDGERRFTDHAGNFANLTEDQVKKEYLIHKNITYYICDLCEVYYWRKAYDVEDAIYEACNFEVENCGYYRMTQKMLAAIKRKDPRFKERFHEDISQKDIFYHEWY